MNDEIVATMIWRGTLIVVDIHGRLWQRYLHHNDWVWRFIGNLEHN